MTHPAAKQSHRNHSLGTLQTQTPSNEVHAFPLIKALENRVVSRFF
uniref:Uncharacterized protein n=1 Tax=Anguilla anguilla TaxID=7936 RepID=A0A0E9TI91_ANGAN